ncbi:MAG: HAMP domain-containing sensor histidine kinase [Ilumatobacteraceae bacterium]
MATDPILRRVGLRIRVAAVACVTVGIALAIGAVLLVAVLRGRLDNAATTAASLRARDIAALAEAGALPRQLALPGEETAFVQVIDQAGSVIASTENITGEPAISTARPAGTNALKLTIPISPLDQRSMRVIVINAHTDAGTLTVYAGENLDNADRTTSAIVTVLVVGLSMLVLIVAAVTWWAVGRTLRPVRDIASTMADITTSDLHRRVEVSSARDEIGQLATTVNATLARLDISVAQQRRFVADASHELRGPLAALRADLEISLTHPERTTWQNVARDTLGDVDRLQELTDDLLVLARIDNELQRPHRPVDLTAIVADALQRVRRRDIQVSTLGLDTPAFIDGDDFQLRRMVRNLIHNAQEHTTSHVNVTLQTTTGTVRLTVADDGPGIPPADRQYIFERFVRLDTARTRDSGGAGLGLAIVHDVVTNHNGTISITDTHPHGATFTVNLPTAPD